MIDYRTLLMLKLSETTQWKNKKEMLMPRSMIKNSFSDEIYTCEFVDLKNRIYIIRLYNCNRLLYKKRYKNNKQNGKTTWFYTNGNKYAEAEYKNGKKMENVLGGI